MGKHPQELFDVKMLTDLIDGFCEQSEIDRLVTYFKSYERPYRKGILAAALDGTYYEAASKYALKYPGNASKKVTGKHKGNHEQWIGFKYRRLAIRILFLRYTTGHEDGATITKSKARYRLFKQFQPFGITSKDTIYRATRPKTK